MTEMFGEAWSPMSVPDLAPDDDDDLTLHTPGHSQCQSSYGKDLCKIKVICGDWMIWLH